MELVIKSRKLNKTLTFFKVSNGENRISYLFVDLNGNAGYLGRQLCKNGKTTGIGIACKDSEFEKEVRKWYRQYLKNEIKTD